MREAGRYTLVIIGIAVVGIVAAAAVLIKQRAPIPFQDVYDVRVSLTSAAGVQPGVGQPVNVAGVKVGTVKAAEPGDDGNALVTLQIERDELPHVYTNARATLTPITPLEDMQMNLDPGRPPAPELDEGGTISSGATSVPTESSELLAALDADTRGFVTSFLSGLDRGTEDRGLDLRRALAALGPTTGQVRRITDALATRRQELARLVHNLAVVTRAASSDRQLSQLVGAGNATLSAIAAQDAPLRDAIARLPRTLDTARSTLGNAAVLSRDLQPTLTALLPATRELPDTLASASAFLEQADTTFSSQLRPLVREAQPLVRDLAPAVRDLRGWAPDLGTSFNALRYWLNELAYNPPGSNEGFLYWMAWTFHNITSVIRFQDAHGPIARVTALTNCQQLTGGSPAVTQIIAIVTGLGSVCPTN